MISPVLPGRFGWFAPAAGEREGVYKWAHLVAYNRFWVRPVDVDKVEATPGDDRDTS